MDRSEQIQAIFDNWAPLKRAIHSYFLRSFDGLEVSPVQLELLRTIRCNQPINHKALAKKMQLTPGAVSQMLDGLEQANCITRTVDSKDRRIIHLSLSDAGEQRLEKFNVLRKQILTEAFAALSDEELAVYKTAQRSMIDWLEAQTETPTEK